MKILAIYSISIFGICLIGLISNINRDTIIGIVVLIPILVFAIMYLVGLKKHKYCGNCGSRI